jgi:hypothetical protein
LHDDNKDDDDAAIIIAVLFVQNRHAKIQDKSFYNKYMPVIQGHNDIHVDSLTDKHPQTN